MKKILVLSLCGLLLSFAGCVKLQQPQVFRIVDAKIFDAYTMSDGRVNALLRFYYKFDAEQVGSIVVERDLLVNDEPKRVEGSVEAVPHDPNLQQDQFSMMIFLPKGATSAKVSGVITAFFENGPMQMRFDPQGSLPVAFR